MTIAITGTTGHFRRLAVARLRDKVSASDIVALARTPARAADLGVPVRAADYAQPATLGAALAADDAFTLADLAAELSRQSGEAIPYRNLPEAEYAAAVAAALK